MRKHCRCDFVLQLWLSRKALQTGVVVALEAVVRQADLCCFFPGAYCMLFSRRHLYLVHRLRYAHVCKDHGMLQAAVHIGARMVQLVQSHTYIRSDGTPGLIIINSLYQAQVVMVAP